MTHTNTNTGYQKMSSFLLSFCDHLLKSAVFRTCYRQKRANILRSVITSLA
jgi:hypothetical protein